jgi:hypothetical protein
MKTINASRLFSREASVSRFEAAKALALSIARSGNEMICRAGGLACVPPDEWTSKLT